MCLSKSKPRMRLLQTVQVIRYLLSHGWISWQFDSWAVVWDALVDTLLWLTVFANETSLTCRTFVIWSSPSVQNQITYKILENVLCTTQLVLHTQHINLLSMYTHIFIRLCPLEFYLTNQYHKKSFFNLPFSVAILNWTRTFGNNWSSSYKAGCPSGHKTNSQITENHPLNVILSWSTKHQLTPRARTVHPLQPSCHLSISSMLHLHQHCTTQQWTTAHVLTHCNPKIP